MCQAFCMQFRTVVKALLSVGTGIHYAIFPALITLILVVTLSLVLTEFHLTQLLYFVCVCISKCALCMSGREKVKEVIVAIISSLFSSRPLYER